MAHICRVKLFLHYTFDRLQRKSGAFFICYDYFSSKLSKPSRLSVGLIRDGCVDDWAFHVVC